MKFPAEPAMRLVALVAITALATSLAGCAGPSRTYDDYRNKAANTVKTTVSAVQTARLAVQAQVKGNATAAYLSVILGESEETVGSVQGTFDSVQPPDAKAGDLRKQVDDYLTQADDILSDLRIAARRGELDQLAKIGAPLAKLVVAMNKFVAVTG